MSWEKSQDIFQTVYCELRNITGYSKHCNKFSFFKLRKIMRYSSHWICELGKIPGHSKHYYPGILNAPYFLTEKDRSHVNTSSNIMFRKLPLSTIYNNTVTVISSDLRHWKTNSLDNRNWETTVLTIKMGKQQFWPWKLEDNSNKFLLHSTVTSVVLWLVIEDWFFDVTSKSSLENHFL